MRVRSNKYPDDNSKYTDTTYFDPNDKYLDIGFQRLKLLNLKKYPELSILTKLFVDHNNLTSLPDPSLVPNLTELTAHYNHLKNIPFYPNLTYLNLSHNFFSSLPTSYNNHHCLIHLDCSHNPSFIFDINLRSLKHLYINNCNLTNLPFNLIPSIEVLDCRENNLQSLDNSLTLTEINFSDNSIQTLRLWPQIIHMTADNNKITILESFPLVKDISICCNLLSIVKTSPQLKKLIASDNQITQLNILPQIQLLDLSNNLLKEIKLDSNIIYVSVQFNSINTIVLSDHCLETLKELQIDFSTYINIYEKFQTKITSINVQTNGTKLECILKKFPKIFDQNLIKKIIDGMSKIHFISREKSLKIFSSNLCKKYFPNYDAKNVEILTNTIDRLYYKTIVITLYFNNGEE